MDTRTKPAPAHAMREHSIGIAMPLVDGIEKVTGRARYTADLPAGEALVGRILRTRPRTASSAASTPPARERYRACAR